MLSGPQRKFCEGIVRGLNQTEAYRAAYPNCSAKAAESKASRMVREGKVKAEIERLREKADDKAGSAVLTLAEKRSFLARVVRMEGAILDEDKDGDLINGLKFDKFGNRVLDLPDKLRAVELDAKLAGELAQDKAADKQAAATSLLAEALRIIGEATHGD